MPRRESLPGHHRQKTTVAVGRRRRDPRAVLCLASKHHHTTSLHLNRDVPATHHARPRERIRVTDFVNATGQRRSRRHRMSLGSRRGAEQTQERPHLRLLAKDNGQTSRAAIGPRARAPHSNNRRVFARGLRMRFLASVLHRSARAPASSEREVTRHQNVVVTVDAAPGQEATICAPHHHTTSLHLRDAHHPHSQATPPPRSRSTTAVAAPQGRPHSLRER